MATEVSAAKVSNSFVTIEGDGVISDGSGGVIRDERASGPVTVTARPGWLVNGRESVSFSSAKGLSGGLKFTSRLGEDHSCCPPPPTSNDVHCTDFVIGAMANPSNVVAMYALPTTSAVVTASASSTVVKEGSHHVTMIWKEWECEICHKRQEGRTNEWDYAVSPDRYAWTATAAGLTFGTSTWTGQMSKGLDQGISFDVVGMRMACGRCRSSAHTEATADVYELSIDLPDEYLGLDLTDAMKEKCVTREATAKIDPAPASATYKWTSCGRCKFIGGKDAASVTYGGNDKTGGSESYLAEPLTVTATAKNAAGQSASASCTTNFTVVAVNVSVGGAGEEGEENSAKEVCYCKDNDDGSLKEFAKANLVPVRITCQPEDLPGIVELAPDSKYAQLFERGKGGSVTLAQTSYPCSEIGKEDFVLHGHSLPDGWWDKAVSFFTTDSLTVTHADSGAIDKGAFKVVPPPPLQVTVNFNSPGKGGIWPYDPVWDNPAYSNTVDGSLAEWCAEHPGEAAVAYMLSRDAAKIEGKIYKYDGRFSSDVEVYSLKNMLPLVGVHINKWSLPKDLKVGEYYAKVAAIEGETGEERSAKSNEGEVVRGDYCYAPNMQNPVECLKLGQIDVYERKRVATEKFIVVEIVGIAAEAIAGIVLKTLKASKGILSLTSTMASEAISYQLTVNSDFGEMPDWLQGGVSIYDGSWTVNRYQWSDNALSYGIAADDVSIVTTVLPNGQVVVMNTTVRSASFDIGYRCYTRMETTNKDYDPEEDERQKVEITKHKGFYSSESMSVGIAETIESLFNIGGDDLSGWIWEEKPYGLLEPFKKFSNESGN